jgi:hypothetical protein
MLNLFTLSSPLPFLSSVPWAWNGSFSTILIVSSELFTRKTVELVSATADTTKARIFCYGVHLKPGVWECNQYVFLWVHKGSFGVPRDICEITLCCTCSRLLYSNECYYYGVVLLAPISGFHRTGAPI